ncbi:MAG: Octanoate-[acyl-carrier-protein]-protein-N-octanoyltransferase [Ignavibacteriae bacterium]|nr:MAG: Octanoate-[acyl-carrier-protein]-protein-N-octanoyltransferase [Ignavibacteriota bacterium]
MNEVLATYLGRTKFENTWKLQKELLSLIEKKHIKDIILLNEHEHVYTIGKTGSENHLLANNQELRSRGIEVFFIDRGGDITYHGPGQLVGYPIIDLNRYYLDIHRYLRDLEQIIILTLKDFNIIAKHDPNFTGVWINNNKIAAIGVKVYRWITMHGFALNVNTDLSYFDRIIPCGIFHKGVTSMQSLLNREINMIDVVSKLLKNFELVFNCKISYLNDKDFINLINKINIRNDEWSQVKQ